MNVSTAEAEELLRAQRLSDQLQELYRRIDAHEDTVAELSRRLGGHAALIDQMKSNSIFYEECSSERQDLQTSRLSDFEARLELLEQGAELPEAEPEPLDLFSGHEQALAEIAALTGMSPTSSEEVGEKALAGVKSLQRNHDRLYHKLREVNKALASTGFGGGAK